MREAERVNILNEVILNLRKELKKIEANSNKQIFKLKNDLKEYQKSLKVSKDYSSKKDGLLEKWVKSVEIFEKRLQENKEIVKEYITKEDNLKLWLINVTKNLFNFSHF